MGILINDDKVCDECGSELNGIDVWETSLFERIEISSRYSDTRNPDEKCLEYRCEKCDNLTYINCRECDKLAIYLGSDEPGYANEPWCVNISKCSIDEIKDRFYDPEDEEIQKMYDNIRWFNEPSDVENQLPLILYYRGDQKKRPYDDWYSFTGDDGGRVGYWYCNSCDLVIEITDK